MKRNNKSVADREQESGNLFLIILLGVVLFGALAFVISRGMRSDTASSMSDRKAELLAVDILSYAQRLERAVNRVRQKGFSENDIDFDNGIVAGYNHTPAQPDNHKIFHPDGGLVTWQSPPADANDGSPWLFTGSSCIAGIGTGPTGCDADTLSNEELIAVLPNLNQAVCNAIDKKLEISAIPSDTGGGYSTTKFQGTFADDTEIILPAAYNAACFEKTGNYHFYYVLLPR